MKVTIAALATTALVSSVALIQSCVNGQPPTKTQVEAAEDKFCEGISKIRAAEKLAAQLSPDAGTAGSAGGPQ